MPPRSALTGSFSLADANNEVVCPLRNQDDSACRKRCSGEKRFRSMQEHIRRAHPDHYIPKLPATEDSFQRMVNTPPSKKPRASSDPFVSPRFDSQPAENAANALAQLQESEWDSDMDTEPFLAGSIELPPLLGRPRELLPSILAHSPPNRYSSLPPIQRSGKLQQPRKSSISRKPKHERDKSREFKRLSMEGRKAMSAEPPTAAWVQGKRWEDLIEAAASATEADDDATPVPPSPRQPPFKQSSLPPGIRQPMQYHASPLQHALTPPPPEANEPFPSVESDGRGFHMPGLVNNTSPLYNHSQSSSLGSRSDTLEVYCASCRRPSLLKACYACTECICAACADCVSQICLPGSKRACPRCNVIGAKWKRFQLDFR